MSGRRFLYLVPFILCALTAWADGQLRAHSALGPGWETRNPGPPPVQPPGPPPMPLDGAAGNEGAWPDGGGDARSSGEASAYSAAHAPSILRPGRESELPLFWLILLAGLSLSVFWIGLSLVRQARDPAAA